MASYTYRLRDLTPATGGNWPTSKQSGDTINRDLASGAGAYSTPALMAASIGTSTVNRSSTAAEPGTNPHYNHLGTWVSDPLPAQTISGTFSVSLSLREGNAAVNMTPRMYIYTWKPNGTIGPVIYSNTNHGREVTGTTTFSVVSYWAASTCMAATIEEDTRIVIELETADKNSTTTSYYHGIQYNNADAGTGGAFITFSSLLTKSSVAIQKTLEYEIDDGENYSTWTGYVTAGIAPSANLANYQHRVKVLYAAGAMNSDYSDIRFAQTNGTKCKYWLESSDTSAATFWVKIPSASQDTLRVYYGKPSASSRSTTAIFEMHDTFSATTNWQVSTTSYPTVTCMNSTVNLSYTTNDSAWWRYTPASWNQGYAVDFKVTDIVCPNYDLYVGWIEPKASDRTPYNAVHFQPYDGTIKHWLLGYNDYVYFGGGFSTGVWSAGRCSSASTNVFRRDYGTAETLAYDVNNTPEGPLWPAVGFFSNGADTVSLTLDWVRVRKFLWLNDGGTYKEPTVDVVDDITGGPVTHYAASPYLTYRIKTTPSAIQKSLDYDLVHKIVKSSGYKVLTTPAAKTKNLAYKILPTMRYALEYRIKRTFNLSADVTGASGYDCLPATIYGTAPTVLNWSGTLYYYFMNMFDRWKPADYSGSLYVISYNTSPTLNYYKSTACTYNAVMDITVPRIVEKFRFRPYYESAPTKWTVQGSNDNVSYVTLQTTASTTYSVEVPDVVVNLTSSTPYRFYKWDIQRTADDTALHLFKVYLYAKPIKLTYVVSPNTRIIKNLQYCVRNNNGVVYQRTLTYRVLTFPTAKTKSLTYYVKSRPAAIQKSLQYMVRSAPKVTASLKYCVPHTYEPITKSLSYDVIGWTTNKQYQSTYKVLSTVAPITKDLKYCIPTTHSFGKYLTYDTSPGTRHRIQKSLSYEILEDYDENWEHMLYVGITSPTTETYYQHKLDLPYKDGMASDFHDIRFAQEDGTKCDYWIQGYTAASAATVWIEVPSASQTNIKLYYGGPTGCTDHSNGDATFLFFDHFTGTTLNTTKWDEIDTGYGGLTYVVEDSTLKISWDGYSVAYMRGATVSTQKIATMMRVKTAGSQYAEVGMAQHYPGGIGYYVSYDGLYFVTESGSSGKQCTRSLSLTDYHILDQSKFTAASSRLMYDAATVCTTDQYVAIGTAMGAAFYPLVGTTNVIHCDWVAIRKTSEVEPYCSTTPPEFTQLTRSLTYRVSSLHVPTKSLTYQIMNVNVSMIPATGWYAPAGLEFTFTSTLPASTWTINFGDGTSYSSSSFWNSTTMIVSHQYVSPSNYILSVTASTVYVAVTRNYPINVTVLDGPVPDFYASTVTGTFPLTVRFENVTYDPSGTCTWYWSFGDGTHSTEKNPTHVYSAPSNYSVTLQVSGPIIKTLHYEINKLGRVIQRTLMYDVKVPTRKMYTLTYRVTANQLIHRPMTYKVYRLLE